MDVPVDLERDRFQLVVIDMNTMRVLLDARGPNARFPGVSIPADARPAASLTDAISDRYGLCTIQLAILQREKEIGYVAVHEIVYAEKEAHAKLCFANLSEVNWDQFSFGEHEWVRRIVNGEAYELGHFAQPGWINRLIARTGLQMERTTQPVVRHLNQGIDFCLLNLRDTSGRNLWFKAVGKPNRREYGITLELARRFPLYVPKIVATVPEWNGWVMENVDGAPLNTKAARQLCEDAFTTLALLQQQSACNITSLLAAGAKDWRYLSIASLLEPFFLEARMAMEAQTSAKSKPFSKSELSQLRQDIQVAFYEFMDSCLPETLLHGDIGHGNVLATSNGPVFLDWAEASIGNPFVCAEHLLADLTRSNPQVAEVQAELRRHYASQWSAYLQPSKLEKVSALAPAMGVFEYCLFVWDSNRDRPDRAQAWPLIRSLLRRTRRELDIESKAIA
jgi:hypothetical protein